MEMLLGLYSTILYSCNTHTHAMITHTPLVAGNLPIKTMVVMGTTTDK